MSGLIIFTVKLAVLITNITIICGKIPFPRTAKRFPRSCRRPVKNVVAVLRAVLNTLPASVTVLESGFPPVCNVGHYVTVGAGSVLISCTIDDLVEIGERCTIMEGTILKTNVILEPGTVVPEYSRIPSGQSWSGDPVQYVEDLDDAGLDHIKAHAGSY